MTLATVDYLVLVLYFAFVIGIGWLLKKKVSTSEDFLTSGRSLPVWITSLAFIATNLGAQEVIGMCASGAKYGIMTAHFYWVGAIPAMLFVGVFMMPFYYGSRARSVPEYLKLRFDEKTRTFNAVTFAVMTIFSSGISMYALGLLFQLMLGWSFTASVLLSAVIVLVYTYLGGLTSAIYNEVLQFFLIVLGFAPLAALAVYRAGGWEGIQQRLPSMMTRAWQPMTSGDNPMGVGIFAMVAGLGFVLSFGYWCTNFLVVQRAMAADSMSSARNTPLIAAFPKMLMPAIVIVPGLAAVALSMMGTGYTIPVKEDGGPNYDLVMTTLMAQFYPAGMLGVGITALMASFMSGMAGNVTAFNTVWTYDIYQSHIRKNAPDSHYLMMGRVATVFGTALSVGTAYLAQYFNNIMDFLQLVFGVVNAPLFATFLLGMFWKRTTSNGAFIGLLTGTLSALATLALTVAENKGGWLGVLHEFPSSMAQNFWIAIIAWTTCFLVTLGVSLVTEPKPVSELKDLVWGATKMPETGHEPWYKRPAVLAVVVAVICILLNIWFR
ncbi:MAG TPA: sodium:solute symporter family protein [Bryobacteraceae bacterium]|nr:sodium:solute symporter family protein [Bryobacteraceae bacterium]HOQ46447.1 sodium:solute symporter family protein [Bryobacteraceae bacterium]HPU72606.1 sodium:solute symporter family protein [Bryobacteraceae bacterium]